MSYVIFYLCKNPFTENYYLRERDSEFDQWPDTMPRKYCRKQMLARSIYSIGTKEVSGDLVKMLMTKATTEKER